MNNQENNKKQERNILIPLAIIVAGLIIGTAIFYTQKNKLTLLNIPSSNDKVVDKFKNNNLVRINVKEDDHIRGNPDAEITVVEFSDFQCPFCRIFHPTMKQILSEYKGKVRWIYKHYPLDMIHSEARPAAEASECAWEQKGDEVFWQFADSLFENQERLGKGLYLELAEKFNLDKTKFEECLNSRRYKDKVESDFNEAIRLGISGTPTSFINGKIIEGALPYSEIKRKVEEALKELQLSN